MTASAQIRHDYLLRRLVILVANETDDFAALRTLAQECALYQSVHLYVFNPSRQATIDEYDGLVYLRRLRGGATFTIAAIAAYYTAHKRLRRWGKTFLPLPTESRGLWHMLWQSWITNIFYHYCEALSIPPLAVVATDPLTLRVAIRLKKRYGYPIIVLRRTESSILSPLSFPVLSPDELIAHLSRPLAKMIETNS